jgi:hypothetical protein
MAAGAYKVWTSDASGEPLDPPTTTEPNRKPNPKDERAVGIYFGVESPPPDDQAALQSDIENVLSAATRIYLDSDETRNEQRFRRYYSRLFGLARVGLEGTEASTKLAKAALDKVAADLVDDEGQRVKTRNLVALAKYGALYSSPFAVAYVLLALGDVKPVNELLSSLGMDRRTMAHFMLLWIGCFVGVCLSYGVRTATFSLTDLTSTGSDRLLPQTRLVFIGTLTMLFGLLFVNGLVEVKVGSKAITDIASDPGVAMLLGILFGMSEAALPAAAAKKASELMEGLK